MQIEEQGRGEISWEEAIRTENNVRAEYSKVRSGHGTD